MFCGGMGVWLYDDMLGLRVANVPSLAPPPTYCPSIAHVDEARCNATLSAASFVREAGLSHHDRLWLCAVLDGARATCALPSGKRGCSFAELRAVAEEYTAGCGPVLRRPSTLTRVVTAAPHADIVAQLGGASGWRSTPGRAALEWTWTSPQSCAQSPTATQEVLVMHATMPAGAAHTVFGVGVPLTHVAAAVVACNNTGTAWSVHVTASFRAHPTHNPQTSEYSVGVFGGKMPAYTLLRVSHGNEVDGHSPFTSANLVSRADVDMFASTGFFDSLSADNMGPDFSNKSILLLQSVIPGLYDIRVELRATA